MYKSKFDMKKFLEIQKRDAIIAKSDNVNMNKEFIHEYNLRHNLGGR